MTHLMACRVCLAYDICLHSISGCQLQDIYEKFTETLLETGDTKPTCVCYICLSLLKKFQKFIEKSKKSDQLLEQMINSGLELSVNSLVLFCKQQTELPWTLDKSPMVRVISATEEKVNVETPIKTNEMDVVDQNEDDLNGITLELEDTNQDASSDSEDILPLQNISKQWKGNRSNVSEIKPSKLRYVLKPDAREIILFKEEQLQQTLERSKSLNYQNSPFEFVDTKALENHQEKHAEVLHLPKERKPDIETEKEIHKSQAPLKITNKGEENEAQNEDSRKIPDFRIRSNTFKTPYIILNRVKTPIKTIIPNNETTTSNINFNQSSVLANHVRIHTGEKPYKCSYCTKCFNVSSALATHVRIHTGEKPYKCSYCTKCFNVSSNLATHVRIHTGEKPYKCSHCTKCFTRTSVLANHLSLHTGEKPYKCSYCTKCFNVSSTLARHVRTHTEEKPYKCSYCTKCFNVSSNLARHVRSHTEEQPYNCSYCTKSFTRRSVFANHLRIHTGEKPYKCSYCIKGFTRSGALAKHVRSHIEEMDKIP